MHPIVERLPDKWDREFKTQLTAELASGSLLAIRKTYKKITSLPIEQQGGEFTLGITATFTVHTQLPLFQLGLATIPARPIIIPGTFNALESDLLAPQGAMLRQPLDACLMLMRLEELAPGFITHTCNMSHQERKELVAAVIKRLKTLASGFCAQCSTPLFIATLPPVQAMGRDLTDLHLEMGLTQARLTINREILQLAGDNPQIHPFDFDGWATREGAGYYDQRMDLFAKQPLAATSLLSLAAEVQRHFTPLLQPAKKVLALDLDNTLWGGILGEDGLNDIKIGRDYPGNIYERIQQQALALKEQGVLLIILSKNNLKDVEEAFATLSHMPLKLDDFVTVKANWQPKSDNLKIVAAELNLGIDSFVFVDDQPFEREQMAHYLPEVTVLPVSSDPLSIYNALEQSSLFAAYHVSSEDRNRSLDYIGEKKRRALESNNGDKEDFLKELQLQAEIRPVDDASLNRVVQMLGKTNQFNVTTHRHDEAVIRNMLGNPDNILLTLSLQDRFADQGIIGLLIALVDSTRPGHLKIDSFLLSCRALGRGAEMALWFSLLQRAADKFSSIEATYIPSKKNSQCKDLFERLNMQLKYKGEDDQQLYEARLPLEFSPPDWIKLKEL